MSAATRKAKPLLVFLDSNVIFSGLHSPGGPPGSVLRHMLDGRITVIVSRQILEEIVRTFKKKLPLALPALSEFLLNSPLEVVSDPEPEGVAHWIKTLHERDDAIIAAAIAAEPDFFVTGDSHFLKNSRLKTESGLQIFSPSDLLKILRTLDL